MHSSIRSLMAGTAMVLVAAPFFAAPVFAQEAAETEQSAGIGEIVVTAQKRATSIQDTPIAMRAFDGEQLTKAGVADVSGLSRMAPDLNIATDTVFTKLSIRGVASADVSETADGALTINIDGEYINRPVALNAALFDLERVEVLRGPQGTLYGRNSTAGALNVIAAKPRLGSFSGFATAGYGNYDAKTAQAAVNIPLGGSVAVRVAGMHQDHDGYTDNGAVGHGDTQNADAVRVGILAEPTDRLTVYLAGEFVDVNQSGTSQYGVQLSATSQGMEALPGSTALVPSGYRPTVNPDRYELSDIGFFRTRQYAVRGRINLDLDFATLSYIGGFRDVDVSSRQPLNGFVSTTTAFTGFNDKMDSDTQSHELRLAGGDEGKFVWQLGAFYYKEHQEIARGTYLPLAGGGSFLSYFYRPYVNSTSKAGYAQATYWLVPDTLSVTGGVRYTDDKKWARYDNYGFQYGTGPTPPADGSPGATTTYPRQGSDKVTWTIGVDYKVAPDSLLYGKVSTGYKGGGFDNVSAYKPETLTAYEIGSKNRFANRTIELNLAGFYYDYRDQQIQVLLDTATGAQTLNAGKSRIWGVEADGTVLLSDRDQFHATVNYLDAKFTEFPGVASTLSGSVATDLSGNRPVQAPKWTIALGYDHTFPIGEGELVASVYSRFKTEYYLTPFNWDADRQQAFTQTDLNLEYKAPGGRYSIQAYVRNLEDERPLTYASFTGGGINIYNFIFGAPRTYGVQGTFRF
ncbi:MAG: TonB-dependent receptor [Novosphingobium sp.]